MQGITEGDIADYLAASPGFFERHAELLGSIQLTSPHGQRAVSLQERQMEMLRDKIKGLERQIVEMIRNGQDNVAIADKLHRWTRALMLTANAADLPDVLVQRAAAPVPDPAGRDPRLGRRRGVRDACRSRAPVERRREELREQPDGAVLRRQHRLRGGAVARRRRRRRCSIALIPLRHERQAGAFGLLVLASPDPTRYTADMGTEFLARIGEVASAALTRLLPAA